MLRWIEIQNFKSFGRLMRVPLEPITVLVGPNNSGKTCFLSLTQFIANLVVAEGRVQEALAAEGGLHSIGHRPIDGAPEMRIAWEAADGSSYSTRLMIAENASSPLQIAEEGLRAGGEIVAVRSDGGWSFVERRPAGGGDSPPNRLRAEPSSHGPFPALRAVRNDPAFAECSRPVRGRLVRLAEDRMRQDAEVGPDQELAPSGAGMAAILGAWRGADSDKARKLDDFLRRCVPEVAKVLVRSPTPAHQRLSILQGDGQEFEARNVSDGLLYLVGLAMQAIDAPDHSMLLVEEPERSVHPRRIHELIDLFRTIATERHCQICLATHSRVVVDRFRDEPEAIMLFRRGERGTEVRRMSDVPDLLAALDRSALPGDMLESGIFSETWPQP